MANVDWLESALNDLAHCWNRATTSERPAISAASNEVDRLLSRNPEAGESRSGDMRITFVGPLIVYFAASPDGQNVTIVHLRLRRRQK